MAKVLALKPNFGSEPKSGRFCLGIVLDGDSRVLVIPIVLAWPTASRTSPFRFYHIIGTCGACIICMRIGVWWVWIRWFTQTRSTWHFAQRGPLMGLRPLTELLCRQPSGSSFSLQSSTEHFHEDIKCILTKSNIHRTTCAKTNLAHHHSHNWDTDRAGVLIRTS